MYYLRTILVVTLTEYLRQMYRHQKTIECIYDIIVA